MQEYKSLSGTNLLEGLIESDFQVAVGRYSSLHIIVVTLETLLLLCLEPGSSVVSHTLSLSSSSIPPLFLFLFYSMSSFFHFTSSFWRMHRYCFLMHPFISLGEAFDLALTTDKLFARNDHPTPDFLLGM